MLHDLAARRSDREIWWLHGARSPQEHALAAEAHALLASLPHPHEHIFYSTRSPGGYRRQAGHAGPPGGRHRLRLRAGRVHDRHAGRSDRPRRRPGPHPHRAVRGHSVDQPRPYRREPPATPPATGSPGNRAAGDLRPQRTFGSVRHRQRSLLDLADACDVPTRWSCRTGVCHTCTTPLLSGDVIYPRTRWTAHPTGDVLICCAQPRTDIVLDM